MTNREIQTANLVATKPTQSPPESNRIYIDMVKAVAKVSLAYLPTEEVNGSLSYIEYIVKNNPNRTYFYPHIGPDGSTITPYYYENEYEPSRYAVTPAHQWLNATTESTQKEDMTATYCIENSNQTPLQGNSTMLLVKAKFTPEQWLNRTGTPGDPSSDGTFWRIAQYKDHTHTEKTGYTSGYYNEIPVLSSPETEVAIEYDNGITYYPIWLKNGDDFLVKRNGYHKVIIRKVNDAGEPDEGIEPEKPIEDITELNMGIIHVDWEVQNQKEILDGNNEY